MDDVAVLPGPTWNSMCGVLLRTLIGVDVGIGVGGDIGTALSSLDSGGLVAVRFVGSHNAPSLEDVLSFFSTPTTDSVVVSKFR